MSQFKNVNEGNATVMPQKRGGGGGGGELGGEKEGGGEGGGGGGGGGEGLNWMEKRRGRTTGRRHNLPVSVPLAGFRRSDGGGARFLKVPLTFRV